MATVFAVGVLVGLLAWIVCWRMFLKRCCFLLPSVCVWRLCLQWVFAVEPPLQTQSPHTLGNRKQHRIRNIFQHTIQAHSPTRTPTANTFATHTLGNRKQHRLRNILQHTIRASSPTRTPTANTVATYTRQQKTT